MPRRHDHVSIPSVSLEDTVRSLVTAQRPSPRTQRTLFDFAREHAADEAALVGLAVALGALDVPDVSDIERKLAALSRPASPRLVASTREQILGAADPLGTRFCELRDAAVRRKSGAVYTPGTIVESMLSWASALNPPSRVVEPGAGSGRFLLEAGKRFPEAELIAVETDPVAALTARANLATAGMMRRARVELCDFRTFRPAQIDGWTLYIGNPPYVRHHLIEQEWKAWLKREAKQLGLDASTLAGLHVYFVLAIARNARRGDCGALITAAEWLDVNYGQLVRDLFLGRLGGQSVHVIDPLADPFPGTATTGAVMTFKIGEPVASAKFARVETLSDLGDLHQGALVRRERLEASARWSHFTRHSRPAPEGHVELGELFRVHRGQVTGANRVWIAGKHSAGLPPAVLFRTVTKAMELFSAGWALDDISSLQQVIDLPVDLSALSVSDQQAVRRFLKVAERMGARNSYIAQHRAAWWAVRLRKPAPILATYMARRPPAFVRNYGGARHINIAHGLYPREPWPEAVLNGLVTYLRQSVTLHDGRVYAGGLTKFEPREMERLPVPAPEVLAKMVRA